MCRYKLRQVGKNVSLWPKMSFFSFSFQVRGLSSMSNTSCMLKSCQGLLELLKVWRGKDQVSYQFDTRVLLSLSQSFGVMSTSLSSKRSHSLIKESFLSHSQFCSMNRLTYRSACTALLTLSTAVMYLARISLQRVLIIACFCKVW